MKEKILVRKKKEWKIYQRNIRYLISLFKEIQSVIQINFFLRWLGQESDTDKQ